MKSMVSGTTGVGKTAAPWFGRGGQRLSRTSMEKSYASTFGINGVMLPIISIGLMSCVNGLNMPASTTIVLVTSLLSFQVTQEQKLHACINIIK